VYLLTSLLYYVNPKSWKSEMREFGKLPPVVKYQNVEGPFKTKTVRRLTFHTLRKSVAVQPTKVQPKWNKHLPVRPRSEIELPISVSLSYAQVQVS